MTTLRLEGVGRTYPGTPPVKALAGVTLTLGAGEFVSFVGPSGSGKSTLLNIIGLLDRPTDGSYYVDDIDVSRLSEPQRAAVRSATFGFVFQSFHLLDRYSALENVELGLLYRAVPAEKRRALSEEALDRVGLSSRLNHSANVLSGGERQRVAIARAIVAGARVLVADEPTGNLDSSNSMAIVELLRDLRADGTGVVLVTHDPDVAAAADRQIALRDGSLVTTSLQGAADPSDHRAVAMAPLYAVSRTRAREFLIDSARAFGARPGRALALVASVGVAVALVVATLGLSQTASAQVSDRFDARLNREVTVRTSEEVIDASGVGGRRIGGLPPDAERRGRSLAGVEEAGLLVDADQQVVETLDSRPAQLVSLIGMSPGLIGTVGAQIKWGKGHGPPLAAREALVGDITGDQLSLAALPTEPYLLVNRTPFAVVGVIRTVERSPELLSAVVVRADDAKEVARSTQAELLIQTAPGAAQQVAHQAPLALDPVTPERFEVDAPIDPTALRAEIEADVRTTMLALSGIAFLAAMVGIANAMSMGVVERIGEFGLRRALGARPRHVLFQVATEAVMTGMMGGICGLYFGLIGVLVVTVANGWQPVLDFRLVPFALGSGALVGAAGGAVAAVRASRIQPIDALRR